MRRAALPLLLLAGCATGHPAQRAPGTAAVSAEGSPAAAPVAAPAAYVRTEPPPPLAPRERHEPKSTRVTLPNGLEVLVVEHHARPLVSVRLYLPSGAAVDSPERAGVTYFTLAGLVGTRDVKDADGELVDPSEKSARAQVLQLGATLRFDVGDDRAWLGIEGFAVDAPTYVEWLNKVVQEERHGEDSFAAHAGDVADRLEELELTDGDALEQFLARLTFGAGHPYARPVYGTPDSVHRMGVEDLVERQASLLTPSGSTLVIVGDVDGQAMVRAAQRAFGGWRKTRRAVAVKLAPPRVQRRTGVTWVPRKPARTTLVCATRPLSDLKAPAPVLQVLAAVMSTRLSRTLREERAFTYTVSGSLLRMQQAQALLVCTRLDASKTQEAVEAFLGALDALARQPLAEDEVATARAQLAAGTEASVDELSGVVRLWGQAVVLGEPVDVAARAAALRAVSLAELEPVAKRVLRPELFQLVMSGERAHVAPAVKALKLGVLRTPQLTRAPAD